MYIVDMIAHANMFDATYYMQSHQLLFLRVVSDYSIRLSKTMHHNLIQHILYHKCRNGETEQYYCTKKSNPHGCAYDATKVALISFIAINLSFL